MSLRGTGTKYPSLKIAFGGRFSWGSDSNLIQRIKLRTCTQFHGSVVCCSRAMVNTPYRVWVQVPQSKNSIWGQI